MNPLLKSQFNPKAQARMLRRMVLVDDLDRITRREDLRSGENAGGESPVLCDGASR